jgi:hypothetical protein
MDREGLSTQLTSNIEHKPKEIYTQISKFSSYQSDGKFEYRSVFGVSIDPERLTKQAYHFAQSMLNCGIDRAKIFGDRLTFDDAILSYASVYVYNYAKAYTYGVERVESDYGFHFFTGFFEFRHLLSKQVFVLDEGPSYRNTRELTIRRDEHIRNLMLLRDNFPFLKVNINSNSPHQIVPDNNRLNRVLVGLKREAVLKTKDFPLYIEVSEGRKSAKNEESNVYIGNCALERGKNKVFVSLPPQNQNKLSNFIDHSYQMNTASFICIKSENFYPPLRNTTDLSIYRNLDWTNDISENFIRDEVFAVTKFDPGFYRGIDDTFLDRFKDAKFIAPASGQRSGYVYNDQPTAGSGLDGGAPSGSNNP